MIPFAPPRIDQAIIDEVTAALKSGWITTGRRTRDFEKQLTSYCGNKATICLNSATAGLELILRWFGVGEGDEVIIPAYTYASTANVIIHCGAKPIMVDISGNFNIDIEKMKAAISGKTKVIMPVDFGGFPCDYGVINRIVSSSEIKQLFKPNSMNQEMLSRVLVLSDAAHSLGASIDGVKTGSLTDISVFSFHAVKNLTTAEGGAVALNLPSPFNNDEVYETLSILSLHGQNKSALSKLQKGNWKYDIVTAGYKYNMTDIAAAIGLVELRRYESDMLPYRKKVCKLYSEFFSKHENFIVPLTSLPGIESSCHLFPLRVRNINEDQRDQVIRKIFDKDVSVNVHFIPLPMHSFYRSLGYDIKHYPVSFETFASEISLPVFYGITDEQLDAVCAAVKESVDEVLTHN